jgi:tetratricopeptide (TPR) repeat protein
LAALTVGLVWVGWAAGPRFDEARRLYDATDFQQSLRVLNAIPEKDAEVHALMGRNYFMLADFKKASEMLEQASGAQPSNSDYALWLGRAYGRRAETSNPFTAPGFASKARQYFEKAARLNPRNTEALGDLFEYYLEAPGFLGGGMDKAQQLAGQIARVDASEGYWAMYKLAAERKDYSRAEEQLRRAIDVAPRNVGKVIELARFLTRQGRYQEADQSFERAEKIVPNSPRLMYAKADLYIKTGRNLDVAKALLERYLNATLTPDDPPRAEAVKLLRKVRGG